MHAAFRAYVAAENITFDKISSHQDAKNKNIHVNSGNYNNDQGLFLRGRILMPSIVIATSLRSSHVILYVCCSVFSAAQGLLAIL